MWSLTQHALTHARTHRPQRTSEWKTNKHMRSNGSNNLTSEQQRNNLTNSATVAPSNQRPPTAGSKHNTMDTVSSLWSCSRDSLEERKKNMPSVFNGLVSVFCLWSTVYHYHVIDCPYTGLTEGVAWCLAYGYQQGEISAPLPQVFPCSQSVQQ